jgi:hypothetical protein
MHHLGVAASVRFIHWKVTPHTLYSAEGSHHRQFILKQWSVTLHTLATYSYINYLEFFYTEDLSISFSFI